MQLVEVLAKRKHAEEAERKTKVMSSSEKALEARLEEAKKALDVEAEVEDENEGSPPRVFLRVS